MRVLVVGLAGTGAAVVANARARDDDVVVVEDSPRGDAYTERAQWAQALGATVLEAPEPDVTSAAVLAADLVVPSPGVPPRHPAITAAVAGGVPVRSEIDLALELVARRDPPPRVVAVTGTNGKTTVTSMVHAMCERGGISSAAVGNIGRPLLEAVDDPVRVLVAEVSTFQLEFTTGAFAPDVAVLLNVAQDHIDWHGSVDAYAAAKAKVFLHQRPGQVAVLNTDDAVVRELGKRAPGRVVTCSRRDHTATFHTADGAIVGPGPTSIALGTTGAGHAIDNALAASAAAYEVGVGSAAIEATLAAWTDLPHRLQTVATVDGVTFVDDSKATNAHATVSALEAFEHVVLVAGGRDRSRNLDVLRPLAGRLRAVVAIGEAGATIADLFRDVVPVVRADSMRAAVRAAADLAERDDTVLLSPACASFDWYSSYAERGDDFAREVASLERHR